MSALTRSARPDLPTGMTVDEFIVWDDGSGEKHQLVDGEVRAMAPATVFHGIIQANLARVIGNALERAGSPCSVVTEPGVSTRVRAKWNLRVPDLGVTCDRQQPGDLALSEPVLLVEIMSPNNKTSTWENVWAYTAIPSVREILVLQLTRIEASLLRRQADGNWPENPLLLDAAGMLELVSVGLSTPISDVYAKTYLAP